MNGQQTFLTGIRKWLLYTWVVLHVVGHFGLRAVRGRMPLRTYPAFLRRAFLFLKTISHSKVVKRGRLYKMHLYIPAYPSRAFFHTLEKLYRPDPGPASVVFSMTRACTYRCPHCYQQRDRGVDLDMDLLIRTAHSMQDAGVSLFDIEGGEPLLRFERLLELVEALDDRAEIWINTTGAGLEQEHVDRLMAARLFGVMVSLHAPTAAEHDAFTGVEGAFEAACEALRRFGEAGAFTVVNCCPTTEMVAGDGLERLIALAHDLGCSFIQVIHGKAAGGWLGRKDEIYAASDLLDKLRALHVKYNAGGALHDYPSVSAQVFEESSDLFGCTSGGVDRFYLGADGEVQPCEFLNVSFGNVRDEAFPAILARMRAHFRRPCTDWLCCTQAAAIDEVVRERGLDRTPVPWEITREFIDQWDRGDETKLYRRLGIYK
jgi:MoaA/NifB/PqqE/SkfB family radical SAM enzyme